MKLPIVIAITGSIAAPAVASPEPGALRAAGARPGGAAFSGTCAVSGTVHFQPGLTVTSHRGRDLARARGTCFGELTGPAGRVQHLNGTPVTYIASDTAGDASCELATGATGTGKLVFPTAVVHFKLSENRVAAISALTLTGRRAGSALGVANVSPSADVLQTVRDCVGAGLERTPVDIHIAASGISG
jgi:hypothetical protein